MYLYSTEFDKSHQVCLVKEILPWYGRTDETFQNPGDVVTMCRDILHLDRKTEEHVYCFSLDTAGHLTGLMEISHGSVNQSWISPREVFQKALLAGAVSIIIVHNHPSGDITPSENDRYVTRMISKAGQLLGIALDDHIIIGFNKYFSFLLQEPFVLKAENESLEYFGCTGLERT